MDRDLCGNAVRLSLLGFLDKLLPIPRRVLSDRFPPVQMSKISIALEDVFQNYKQRAEVSNRIPEDQLASDFANVINANVLGHCSWGMEHPNTTLIVPIDSNSAAPSSQQTPRQTGMVDEVPRYVIRLSPHSHDLGDAERDSANAALFRKDLELEEGRPNWEHQQVFFHFKQEDSQNDPFDEAQEGEEEALEERKKVWGQLIAYADQLFLYQHRTAAFSLLVIGREFRVMRWDRSGVFVSEKVNYLLRTDALVEVLLAFTVIDDEAQGFDTSATLLQKDSDDYRLMDTLADVNIPFHLPVVGYEEGTPLPKALSPILPQPPSIDTNTVNGHSPGLVAEARDTQVTFQVPSDDSFVFEYVLDYFCQSVTDWPRYNLTVDDEEFLVCEPLYHTRGLIGRGTRGYVAYRKWTRTFVFLKDSWRSIHENVASEREILGKLNTDGVRNIPSLVRAHLFRRHETRLSHYRVNEVLGTKEERKVDVLQGHSNEPHRVKRTYSEMQEEPTPYVPHYGHHRLVLKEVCLPITAFRSSRQLLSIIGDSIEAHYDATVKSKILHCDISSGNILILPTFVLQQEGDMTLHVTWIGHVETADEIESFFNVLLYNVIRYCPHNMELHVPDFINRYFVDFRRLPTGTFECPETKVYIITSDGALKFGNRIITFGRASDEPNEALNTLILELLDWFKARYEVKAYDRSLRSGNSSAPSDPSDRPARCRRIKTEASSTGPAKSGKVFGKKTARRVSKPSAETYELASNLKDHTSVRDLFWQAKSWDWLENEVLQDHLDVLGPLPPVPEES
ncbi:hypothetical protein BD310DRAFT_906267 [Dichomitus squalens]|uniref:Fungal-type protein kinase domain-containing protein n=1 Tax=Dichomitus squalens TaxID=114155 RepID=A0A4Q9PWN0_9APHY|nr:hypothetical protein BD310DRAFT_906267 [Dichomitus squalens]